MAIPGGAFNVRPDGSVATLTLKHLALVDDFEFAGPLSVPGMVDINVVWRANEDPQPRGKGTSVPADSAEAFLGRMSRAKCTCRASAVRTGFSFRTVGQLGRNGYLAEMGRTRNGVFL